MAMETYKTVTAIYKTVMAIYKTVMARYKTVMARCKTDMARDLEWMRALVSSRTRRRETSPFPSHGSGNSTHT